VKVRDLVDHAERQLDERGLDRPHIAGNSIGGWMAIELARRGRARTVCALSPGGSWTAGTGEQTLSARRIRMAIRSARMGRLLPLPLLMRSAKFRRLTLRDAAVHGDRLTAMQALEASPGASNHEWLLTGKHKTVTRFQMSADSPPQVIGIILTKGS
jgi:pimeloyl-ACP methyl ester carboxylesterase